MVYEYSAETTPLQPARLGSAEFRAIGRIIRSCAEIEDCITLFIVKLLDTPEGNVWMLLGQTPISKKLSIAAYLAKMRADDLTTIFEATGRTSAIG